MSTIVLWLKRTLLVGMAAILGLATLPIVNAYALGETDTAMPRASTQISSERLERIWAREQRVYEHLGIFFDHADQRVSNAQDLIDKARGNGKDVSAVQAALDAFSAAVTQARPAYESGKGILASHPGFDAAGQVTNQEQALATIKDLGGKLKEVRQTLADPMKALRQAIRDFRAANRPTTTPTPT